MCDQSYISVISDHIANLRRSIESNEKYSSVTTTLVNPKICRYSSINSLRLTRSPLILSTEVWSNRTIMKINYSQIDCDSDCPHIRKESEKVLRSELGMVDHMMSNGGLTYIQMPLHSRAINLSKILGECLKGQVVVEIPLVDPKADSLANRTDLSEEERGKRLLDTWKLWNEFRQNCEFNTKVKIALIIPSDIPSEKLEISRWFGEPVEYLIIPSSIFISNSSNYPVLSRAHQELLRRFLRITKMGFILVPNNLHDQRLKLYAEYLHYMNQHLSTVDPMQGYDDYLEVPLQPLHENLDFYTYEIFEKDPIKYLLYQKAIETALIDKVPEDKIAETTITLMVVGAGRGPLVRSALNAAANTGRKMKVFAVEKNPNAISILTALIDELWSEKDVTLISTDMRNLDMKEKADIIVSELLGSFGDNELSPECLDGVQSLLKEDGISIPSKSSSYLRPVMSAKIHQSIKNIEKTTGGYNNDSQYCHVKVFDFNYVVYLKNYFAIDKCQEVFTFVHPNREPDIDNTRYKLLNFKSTVDCILHGFAGYFEAVLYKDIILSIHPDTHTEGLTSWFSMFFPIEIPQKIKSGDEIKIHFWRKSKPHKVWYEWKVTSPDTSKTHNHDGHSHPILK